MVQDKANIQSTHHNFIFQPPDFHYEKIIPILSVKLDSKFESAVILDSENRAAI